MPYSRFSAINFISPQRSNAEQNPFVRTFIIPQTIPLGSTKLQLQRIKLHIEIVNLKPVTPTTILLPVYASDTGGQYPMFPVSAFVARRMTLTIVYLANGGHMSTSGTTPYETHMHYAEILKDICIDVRTEPGLLPVNPATLCSTAIQIANDQARLDIVATGLWAPFERTYFDVRITHPTIPLPQM